MIKNIDDSNLLWIDEMFKFVPDGVYKNIKFMEHWSERENEFLISSSSLTKIEFVRKSWPLFLYIIYEPERTHTISNVRCPKN